MADIVLLSTADWDHPLWTNKQHVAFFVYAVTLGYGMTIVENLVFLLFRDLGASYFVCGITVVVTVIFEIPILKQAITHM